MAIDRWQPSTVYLPDQLVIPTVVAGATATVIPNADFESGDTGWTKGTGWAINTNGFFSGATGAEYSGPGIAILESSTKHVVAPGKAITAKCFIDQGASVDGEAEAAVILRWYTAADVFISDSTGNVVSTGVAGVWKTSSVSAVAPPTAGKVAIGCTADNSPTFTIGDILKLATGDDFLLVDASSNLLLASGAALYVDNFQWNYVTGAAAIAMAYKAIQAEAGTSSESEPIWPTVVSNTVVDNDITWEAVAIDSVTWEASSILTSGSVEPTWPAEPDTFVSDNNIAWKTIPLRIEDEKCPNTKEVAIAASKVFAGDVDVTRFCATLNARDWTSKDDAGFLPSGLQQKSQVGVDALGVYRGNLCIWSASTFQVWQVDPDPAVMALLDSMEGIGTIHRQAVQPVSDDLFFLPALGVRTVSIAEGSNNLATGDVGIPIDTLIQAEIAVGDVEPIASYFPGAGQYMLAFRPVSILAALLVGQFCLTSPIYPIEAVDGMGFSISMQSGSMIDTLEEAMDSVPAALDGTITQILFTAPTQDEAMDSVPEALDGTVTFTGLSETVDEAMDSIPAALDGTIDESLVTALMPDEGLGFTIAMISGDMTDA